EVPSYARHGVSLGGCARCGERERNENGEKDHQRATLHFVRTAFLGIVRVRSLNPRNRVEPFERKAKSAGEASLSPRTRRVNPAGTTRAASPTSAARRLRSRLWVLRATSG